MGSISSKIRSTIIALSSALILTACNNGQSGKHDLPTVSGGKYLNQEIGYSFDVPNSYSHETDDEEGMYFGYSTESTFGKVTVQSYDQLTSPCSPSLTGASQMTPLSQANGEALWGRADGWDQMDENGNYPEGYESPIDLSQAICNKNGTPHPKEVYALCSQKDGKTVVICINQAKDDPEMAKQIFESFRWTE